MEGLVEWEAAHNLNLLGIVKIMVGYVGWIEIVIQWRKSCNCTGMEQIPWGADSCPTSQEIPCLLWNLKLPKSMWEVHAVNNIETHFTEIFYEDLSWIGLFQNSFNW